MKLIIFLSILSGCSMFFGSSGPKSAKSHYSVDYHDTDWEQVKDKQSDYVFENKSDGRIILSNSFCEEFQDQPLDSLAAKTFNTVKDFKKTRNEYTTLQNREAYRLEGTGLVDGVSVVLKIVNTRRDNCYFDFVGISPANKNISKDMAFDDFLSKVDFE